MRCSSSLRCSRALSPLASPSTPDVWAQSWAPLGVSFHFCWGLPPSPDPAHGGPWAPEECGLLLWGWLRGGEFIALSYVFPHPFFLSRALFICWGSDEVIDCPASDVCAVLNLILLHNNRQTEGEVSAWARAHTHTHNRPKQGTILRWTWYFKRFLSLLAIWEPFSHLVLQEES